MFLFSTVAAATLVVVAAFVLAFIHDSPDSDEVASSSSFINGQLWTKIDASDFHGVGLIDTGTSRSLFVEQLIVANTEGDEILVETAFNTAKIPTFLAKEVEIFGQVAEARRVFKPRKKYSIIGIDYLLNKKRVLLSSKKKLSFDYISSEEFSYCSGITMHYSGVDSENRIAAIFMDLPINGANEKVFIDTGHNTFIEATGQYQSQREPQRRVLNFLSNALGESRFEWYGEVPVRISIGEKNFSFKIKHYFENKSANAPFVIGSLFLEQFDIYIEFENKLVCLREARD